MIHVRRVLILEEDAEMRALLSDQIKSQEFQVQAVRQPNAEQVRR